MTCVVWRVTCDARILQAMRQTGPPPLPQQRKPSIITKSGHRHLQHHRLHHLLRRQCHRILNTLLSITPSPHACSNLEGAGVMLQRCLATKYNTHYLVLYYTASYPNFKRLIHFPQLSGPRCVPLPRRRCVHFEHQRAGAKAEPGDVTARIGNCR